MAGWFGGGGGFPSMGGLGDRLLGGRGLPAGNPYTGGTGGAYGRGSGSAYGVGEGGLSADARALAARGGGGYPPPGQGRPMQASGGIPPTISNPYTISPQPFGGGVEPSAPRMLPGGGGGVRAGVPMPTAYNRYRGF